MAYTAKIESVFEMVDYGLASSSAAISSFNRSLTQLNKGDFDGDPQFFFEIVATNANASVDYDVILRDVTNSADVATITVVHQGVATLFGRQRSAALALAAGEVVYQVKLPKTGANSDVVVHAARIIVQQGATATKTVVEIPLIHAGYNLPSGSDTVYPDSSSNGTSYSQTTPNKYTRWLKTASAWATVSGCALDAVISSSNAAATATAGIVDVDDSSSEVSGATVSKSGTAAGHLYSIFAWAGMTDGHQFELKGKSSSASYNCRIWRASLRIFLSDLQKGEVYKRCGGYSGSTSARVMATQRVLYDSSLFSNPTCYFEAAGLCADDANVVSVYEVNADSGAGGGASVTDSGINWNSSTKARKRTAAIAPTSGYNAYCRTSGTTGAQAITGQLLVISWTGVPPGCPVQAMNHYRQLRSH
jgi:hypothetical protein